MQYVSTFMVQIMHVSLMSHSDSNVMLTSSGTELSLLARWRGEQPVSYVT